MLEESLVELIELVKSTAPELWRISLLQVRATLITDIITLVFILLGIIISLKIAIFMWKKYRKELANYPYGHEEMYFIGAILLGLAFVVGIFTFPVLVNTIVVKSINPEFYALQLLMNLVK